MSSKTNKGASFKMDARNPGGRQVLIEHMLAHQNNLRKIKSVINTGSKRPQSAPPKGVDCSEPKTYHLSDSISRNRQAAREVREKRRLKQETESLQKRIEQYPSMMQRKQNPNDFVAHPALILRISGTRDELCPNSRNTKRELYYFNPFKNELLPHTTVHDSIKLISPNRAIEEQKRMRSQSPSVSGSSPDSLSDRHSDSSSQGHSDSFSSGTNSASSLSIHGQASHYSERTPPRLRPHSAAPALQSRHFEEKYGPTQHSEPAPQPVSPPQVVKMDPYEKLKKHLFDLIVQHRIYREPELVALFDKARALNTHLDLERVDRVLTELRVELSMPTGAPPDPAGQAPLAS